MGEAMAQFQYACHTYPVWSDYQESHLFSWKFMWSHPRDRKKEIREQPLTESHKWLEWNACANALIFKSIYSKLSNKWIYVAQTWGRWNQSRHRKNEKVGDKQTPLWRDAQCGKIQSSQMPCYAGILLGESVYSIVYSKRLAPASWETSSPIRHAWSRWRLSYNLRS